jgi:cbb3-type cytochrome oxidase maturation protein
VSALAWLSPAALFLGLLGLAAFLWALRSGQFEDLEGASWRAIQDNERPDVPIVDPEKTDRDD